MVSRIDQRQGAVSPELQRITTILAAVTDARFRPRFPKARVKGFMNQTGVLCFSHDFQGFFFADFFGKSLGCGMACGFAERKAIQCGGIGAARIT
jgi:hypothetical protein